MTEWGITARLAAIFQAEAQEHLQVITRALGGLQTGSAEERDRAADMLFRAVHTLKGAARSVGFAEIEARCQGCESLLSDITHRRRPLTAGIAGELQEAAAEIARLLFDAGATRRVESPAAPAGRPGPANPPPVAAAVGVAPREQTIRVVPADLDRLLGHTEDLLVVKLTGEERAGAAHELADALARCRRALDRTPGRRPVPRPGDDAVDLPSLLRTFERHARSLATQLASDQRVLSTSVDRILEGGRRLRMAPVSTILDAFPGMVRSLAGSQGKDVEWVTRGTRLEIDRQVLALVKDPLIHLVRNAIDHGLETPDVRAAAGKPARGRIEASCTQLEGGRVEFRVEDDGRGIDLEQVRAAAVRARLLTAADARSLPEAGVLDLIYRSGLSTSPVVTNVSGHGLGMAVVRERAEKLGGWVHTETHPGGGTAVRIAVPATIATFRGLLVRAAGHAFLLPVTAVERVIKVDGDAMARVEGRDTVPWNGISLPAARLADLLALAGPAAAARAPAVVVRVNEDALALLVDEVLGDREVLVKEFRPPLVRVRNIAAVGLLGHGEMAPVLRPADLLASARETPRGSTRRDPTAPVRPPPVVLVVDDSITTRTMEKNLLESAGYRTLTAVDGLEAWSLLRSEEVDLVLSDVDTPRMNGFELTARIRADRERAELPVVLVTALESREDRERGVEAGANAYVVKSGFDQSRLLDLIQRLV